MTSFKYQKKEVLLIPVPGIWISCHSVVRAPNATNENTIQYFDIFKPKRLSPDNDDLCIIHAMPAISPFINESALKESEKHVEISAPLKGSKSPYSDKLSQAYRSGTRSCVVPCRKVNSDEVLSSQDWVIARDDEKGVKYVVDFEHGTTPLRIKGCGIWLPDDQQQFPGITLESDITMHTKGVQVLEIRGVCFENTSCTEMISTQDIEENLYKIGLLCGNHSVGFWILGKLQNDVAPLITKTVSIFETLGDSRLETHLYPGLEILLSKKYDQSFASRVIELITPLYENMKDKFPSNSCKTTRKRRRVNMPKLIEKVNDGSFFNLNDMDIDDFSDDKLRAVGLVPTYDIYERIKDLDKDFVNLVKLYGRIGFEVGRILSVVHRIGYLWGSYTDHDPEKFHVNAHTGNLIVLDKEDCLSNKKKLQIIAPVDFDMSFRKENAINIWRTPPFPDIKYVTHNIRSEVEDMGSAIGGWYATFEGVSNFFKTREQPPGLLCNILWLLRDCGLYEYFQGYQRINCDRCKGNDITADDAYKIIYEALAETTNNDS